MAGPTIVAIAPATPAAAVLPDNFTGPFSRISYPQVGVDPDGTSDYPTLNGDGTLVLFTSDASNLVPSDGNGQVDLFLRDRETGALEMVDVSSSGARPDLGLGTAYSERGSLSDDGRFVVFTSRATNLIADDTNGKSDVYLRDRQAQTTVRLSTTSAGTQATGKSYSAWITADGAAVFFLSESRLTADDTDGDTDLFRKDLATGDLALVSVGFDATPVGGPRISSDGRYVVFSSGGKLFRRDTQTSTTIVVVSGPGGGALSSGAAAGGVSDDGNRIVFHSTASGLTPNDPAGSDAYYLDVAAGTIERLTDAVELHDEVFSTSISRDGSTLTYDLMNGPFYLERIDEGRTIELLPPNAYDLVHFDSWLNADGTTVAFATHSSDLTPGNTGGRLEVFAADVDPDGDLQAPEASCEPADGQWHAANVSVTCDAHDPSGLSNPANAAFSLATNVASGAASGNATTGTKKVCDVYSHCVTVSSSGHKVDRKRPTVTVADSSKGSFVRSAVVPAALGCSDGPVGAGIASCSGKVGTTTFADGEPLPTATAGSFTIAVTATDAVGNTGTGAGTYTVTDDALTGTISRPSGGIVSGARIGLWAEGASQAAATATTGSDGSYRFDAGAIAAGTYALRITKPGWEEAWYGGADRASATPVAIGVRPATANATLAPLPGADDTAPVVSCQTPSLGAVYTDNIVIGCNGSDDVALANGDDGGFLLATAIADGTETLTALTPARPVCDTSDNCTSAGPFGPYKVDRKAPDVTINFPTQQQVFQAGTTINGTDFDCKDLTLVSCTSSNTGTNLPNTVGIHSFTVTGIDGAGHQTQVTRLYVVQGTTLQGKFFELPNEKPIAGATVDLWVYGSNTSGPPTVSTTTTATGYWAVNNLLVDTPYAVRFTKAGYTTVWYGQSATFAGSTPISGPNGESQLYSTWTTSNDTTGPTFSCTPPSSTTWRSTQATVPCTASDPSGINAGFPTTFTLTTNVAAGVETASATTNTQGVCDTRGNCSTAGPFTFKVDRKAPVTSCPTPSTAWTRNVSFNCTSTDGGAGTALPTFTLATSVAANATNSNASTNATSVCDALSNCAVAQITGLKIDMAAPTATCPAAPTTWFAVNQSITCTVADSGSGYTGATSVPATTAINAGVETSTAPASTPLLCDLVSNCAAKTVTGFKIDRKGPTLSCAAADGAWHNANVSLACSHSDAGAGLPTQIDIFPPLGVWVPYQTSFTAYTNAATGSESSSVAATSSQKCDVLNNCTTVSITGNKIDLKAPTKVSCPTPTTAWLTTNQTAICTAADGGSGLVTTSYNATTTVYLNEETASAPSGAHVCDKVLNCATLTGASPWKIDQKPPSASCPSVPTPGSILADNASISCSVADGGSGLASSSPPSIVLETSVASGAEATVSTNTKTGCDLVGNCATYGPYGPYDVDRKVPTVSITAPADGQYVQEGASLLADYACADLFLSSCTAATANGDPLPTTLGAHDLTVTATDRAGHTATTQRSYTVLPVDHAPPVLSCTPPAPGTAWRSANVSVPCTATDASPLAGGLTSSFTVATTVAAGEETAAASTAPKQVCDVFGNCATTLTYGGYKIDRKAPAVPCAAPPAGWVKTNASMRCTISDGGSGAVTNSAFDVATTVAAGAWDGDASTTTKSVCDKVGNCTTAGYQHLKVDRAGPVATCDAPPTGWSKDNVGVTCTPSDPGAGYAGAPTVTALTALKSEQESNDAAASVDICDVLGNCTKKTVTGFKVDRKLPVLVCGAADSAWHSDNVTFSCEQSDGGSGLAPTSPNGGAPTFDVATAIAPGNYSANAAARAASAVCDLAGNCRNASISGNKIDRKPPTVSCPAADTDWHADNVTVTCTVADIGSGAVAPTFDVATTVAVGTETSTAATSKGSGCDLAGNCITIGAPGRFKIDRKAPKATITAPAPGSTLVIGSSVTVAYTCTDEGSGATSCTGPLAPGATLIATAIGPQTFAVESVDTVGNHATTTVSWQVAAPVSGRVIDTSGNGAAGVTVSRYAATGDAGPIDTVLTDADGFFQFVDAAPGSYRFGAAKPGSYLPRFFGSSTLAGAPAYSVDGVTPRVVPTLTLTPAATIGGKVTSASTGDGIGGVEVAVYNNTIPTAAPIARVTTEADGTWRVGSLPAGTYRYSMTAAGYVTEWHLDATSKASSTGVALVAGEQAVDLLDDLVAAL